MMWISDTLMASTRPLPIFEMLLCDCIDCRLIVEPVVAAHARVWSCCARARELGNVTYKL
jgi:hypothetical protein